MSSEVGGWTGGSEAGPQQTPEMPAERKPDIRVFHERAKASGAYDRALNEKVYTGIDERRRRLMEAYFTTPASYEDLRPLAGGVTGSRVTQLIRDGLRRLWHYVPQEMLEEYSVTVEDPITKEKVRRRRMLEEFEFPHKPKRREGRRRR
jgi:hypothetical protein